MGRWSNLWAVGLVGLGCSASERAGTRTHVSPRQDLVALGSRETNSVETTVRGRYPQLAFHFVDCVTGRDPTWITEITVVRENRTVCLVTSPEKSLPPVWHYSDSVRTKPETCEPLTPGLYGIKLYGGEMGQAEFQLAEDGTVSLRGVTCAAPSAPRALP